MNTRKIVGTLMLAAPFVAIAAFASIASGHWWMGPALLAGAAAIIALMFVAIGLLMGEL